MPDHADAKSDGEFRPELGKPVRFLAIAWDADWEFDLPGVLLEPVKRYTDNGARLDELIESVAIDISLDAEEGRATTDKDPIMFSTLPVASLREAAEAQLAGRAHGLKGCRVLEQWLVFRPDEEEGEITFENAPPPHAETEA